MELKKLVKTYIRNCSPVIEINFADVADPNDLSSIPKIALTRVHVKWQNNVEVTFSIEIGMTDLEITKVCHTVCMHYYTAQQNLITENFLKKNKIKNTPSLIVPNDLSIIN